MKYFGQVQCVTSKNSLDFGGDTRLWGYFMVTVMSWWFVLCDCSVFGLFYCLFWVFFALFVCLSHHHLHITTTPTIIVIIIQVTLHSRLNQI